MTFDETLLALCEKHGLNTISVSVTVPSLANKESYAYANTHWDGEGHTCSSGNGANAAEAIADAINNANARRGFNPTIDLPSIKVAS